MALNSAYTTYGVCYVQLNRNDCDGTPLTAADGDNNVIILGTAGDATEVELAQQYRTQAAQSDGNCWFAPEFKTKTGAQMTVRHCSQTYHDNIALHGLWEPLYTPAGVIDGYSGGDVGDSDCCHCVLEPCVSDGFSVISYSCPQLCDGNQLRDVGGNRLWEVTIATWVPDGQVTEVQNRRRSQTPSNNRVDYQYDLRVNENYGTGPGSVFATDAVFEADGTTVRNTDVLVFLTSTPPPNVDCACDSEAFVGQFITQAQINAGSVPVPLGDAAV